MQLQLLEEDPDVDAGRRLEGRLDPDVDWKGRWIRTLLLKVDWKGRWIRMKLLEMDRIRTSIGKDDDCKGWIRTSLLEGLDSLSIGRVGRDVDWKGWIRRRLEGDWKGWIRRQLEGDWKGWIRRMLLEGTSIGSGRCCWTDWNGRIVMDDGPDVVDGRDVGSRCCCWKGIGRDGDWKGWIQTSIGRVGRDVDWKGCCCFC